MEMSKRDSKQMEVDNLINSTPKGTEIWNTAIASQLGETATERQGFRDFLSKYLLELEAKGIIKFVGWKESRGPVKRKVYKKV